MNQSVKNPLRVSWPHVVLGVLGIGVSLYSVYLHQLVKNGGSACGATETINCDKVLGSQYAVVFGIPLGYYGAVFFALVILLGISTLPPDTPLRQIIAPRLLLATAGICGSIALTALSWFVLHSLCKVCLATHAVTFSNFLYTLYSWLHAGRTAPAPQSTLNPTKSTT